MDKKKTCYLFFDLDGTVYLKGSIPDETLQAMCAAQALGHKLILNTGRSRGNTIPFETVFDVPWDGMIFGGGAEILWNNERLFRQTVSSEICYAWLAYCLKNGYTITFGGSDSRLTFDLKENPALALDENREKCVALLDQMLATDHVTNLTVRTVLRDDYPKTGMTVIQLSTYADIFAPDCNKGRAIKHFCDLTGASLEQCVGFGDSQNDVEMFRVCPTSICMNTAPAELVVLSTYCAKTDRGVAEGLRHLFDIE